MTDQNSRPNNSIRPEALQAELSIKSSTYYDDLSYLGREHPTFSVSKNT